MRTLNKIFTISNILSMSRIIALPFILYLIKYDIENKNLIIICSLFFLIATDFFDGYLARKLNQISKLGKILDPIADKVCIITASYLITLYKNFPIWAFIIIVIRELIVLAGSLILIKKKNFIPTSNIIGKVSVFILSLSFLGYIFLNQELASYTLLIIGLTLYLISFIYYFLRYLRVMEYIQKHIIKLAHLFQQTDWFSNHK